MSFLYLHKGDVLCKDDAFTRDEVMRVYGNDNTGKGKINFNEIITALYFIYTPRAIYWNKSIEERIKIVNSDHLKKNTFDRILKFDGVPELIKLYISLCQTINDKMYDKLKSDADELIELCINTPMTIKHMITAGTVVKDKDGVDRELSMSQTIIIPNVDAKKIYYDAALKLAETMKKIQDNLRIEEEEREKEAAIRRMYDDRGSNKIEK